MKKYFVFATLFFLAIFESCSSYDHDLMYPDRNGSGYNLTPLGCLVNGPFYIDNFSQGYNSKIFLNDSEISSVACTNTDMQKDLVFQLHKGGSLTYWLKSENRKPPKDIVDTTNSTVIVESSEDAAIEKKYDSGFWKVNFQDSSLLIHFSQDNIPELRYKISYLSSNGASFQETYFFDSTINNKIVRLKRVNTINYSQR